MVKILNFENNGHNDQGKGKALFEFNIGDMKNKKITEFVIIPEQSFYFYKKLLCLSNVISKLIVFS